MEATRGSACEPGMHACTHDVDVTQVAAPPARRSLGCWRRLRGGRRRTGGACRAAQQGSDGYEQDACMGDVRSLESTAAHAASRLKTSKVGSCEWSVA